MGLLAFAALILDIPISGKLLQRYGSSAEGGRQGIAEARTGSGTHHPVGMISGLCEMLTTATHATLSANSTAE